MPGTAANAVASILAGGRPWPVDRQEGGEGGREGEYRELQARDPGLPPQHDEEDKGGGNDRQGVAPPRVGLRAAGEEHRQDGCHADEELHRIPGMSSLV